MEIKLNRLFINVKLIVFLVLSFSVTANDLNKIEINLTNNNSNEVNTRSENNKEPLRKITIFYNNIILLNNKNTQSDNLKISLQQPSNVQDRTGDYLSLGNNEYVQIKGVDNRIKLFNGSIIIKFKDLPSLDQYAQDNGLMFVGNLSDINRGIFKVSNLYELEAKINELKLDNNVVSIELDTIDPLITNK